MSEHRANIEWRLEGAFDHDHYSRVHSMRFDGGNVVTGNGAPGNIPATVPAAAGVDPEQAFVASLSACHMLWFLALACKTGWKVERYSDNASGVLERNDAGRMAMTRVTLRPLVVFSGTPPAPAELEALHHKAHEHCFIANSVNSKINIEAQKTQ
jgi:organic hydroperoxide reductase OsmC/OhrA